MLQQQIRLKVMIHQLHGFRPMLVGFSSESAQPTKAPHHDMVHHPKQLVLDSGLHVFVVLQLHFTESNVSRRLVMSLRPYASFSRAPV